MTSPSRSTTEDCSPSRAGMQRAGGAGRRFIGRRRRLCAARAGAGRAISPAPAGLRGFRGSARACPRSSRAHRLRGVEGQVREQDHVVHLVKRAHRMAGRASAAPGCRHRAPRPRSRFSRSATTSAASSTIAPRDTLIRKADGFIRPSSSRADQVARLVVQHGVDRDDVACREQRAQIVDFRNAPCPHRRPPRHDGS